MNEEVTGMKAGEAKINEKYLSKKGIPHQYWPITKIIHLPFFWVVSGYSPIRVST
jgi:hypothetical protein